MEFWDLFDIRKGRANKIQYFVVYLSVFILIKLLTHFSQSIFSVIPFLLCLNYIYMIFLTRRMRDINYDPRVLVGLFFFFNFILQPIVMGMLVLSVDVNNPDIQVSINHSGLVMAKPILAAVGFFNIMMLVLTIIPGSPGKNKHGHEPKGLDFKTMFVTWKPQDDLQDDLAPWRRKRDDV